MRAVGSNYPGGLKLSDQVVEKVEFVVDGAEALIEKAVGEVLVRTREFFEEGGQLEVEGVLVGGGL